jgi:hypothetical protein
MPPRRLWLSEAVEMRRNSKITIPLIAAIVGLSAFALVMLSAPSPGMIGLGIQSYTNACAVVTVTNLSGVQIDYLLAVERKITKDWPSYHGRIPHNIIRQTGVLRPREVSTLTVPVMVYAPPYPWRLSLFCSKPPTNPSAIRVKAGLWLLVLHMPKLAHKVLGERKVVQVSGPQMEQ